MYEQFNFNHRWEALKFIEDGGRLFIKEMASDNFGYEFSPLLNVSLRTDLKEVYVKLSDDEVMNRHLEKLLGERMATIDELSDFINNMSPSAKKSSEHSAAAIYDFISKKLKDQQEA